MAESRELGSVRSRGFDCTLSCHTGGSISLHVSPSWQNALGACPVVPSCVASSCRVISRYDVMLEQSAKSETARANRAKAKA
jgi:hypothetical protein